MIKNIKGGPITTIFGIIIAASAIASVFLVDDITWIWEGMAGVGLGIVLILIPDYEIRKIVVSIINGIKKKLLG